MKKYVAILLGSVLLVVLCALWLKDKAPSKNPRDARYSNDLSVKKPKKDTLKEYTLETHPYLSLGSKKPRVLNQRYVGLGPKGGISEAAMETLKNGKCAYHDLYDRETNTYEQGKMDAPLDIPKVEIRFRKRDADGNLVPHPVGAVLTYPVWNGRSHPSRDRELFRAMDCGQTDEYDFAHAARFFLSDDPNAGDYDSLVFGQTYYMEFLYPDYRPNGETADHYGSAVIEMPEHVDRGKMAVFTVDVTNKVEEWGRPSSYSKKKKQVHIRVRNMPSVPHVAASLYDPTHDMSLSDRVTPNGEAEIGVHELGGELVVIAYVAKEEGYLLYYKRRVTEQEVELPEDADIVVEPDDVVSFDLQVPAGKEVEEAIGLGLFLFLRRDSKIAVAGAEVERGNGRPHSVELMAPPGSYYVGGDFENPELIGKITVSKSDAGRTLQVQPLEE